MKILFVMMSSVEDLNSSVLRNLALIKGILSLGNECTLVCTGNYEGITLSDISKYDFLNDVKIVRLNRNGVREKILSEAKRKTIRVKMVSYIRKIYHSVSVLGYSKKIAKTINISVLNGENDYDVVISSSDPKASHLAVRTLKKQGLNYGKWIEYWGDPLAIDLTNEFVIPKCILKRIEVLLFKHADKIFYVSPFTLVQQKVMYKKYAKKMHFVPIPYISAQNNLPVHNTKYTISYIGAYNSRVRNILPLYSAMIMLNKEVVSYIVGDSDVILEEKENIHILPRGDASEIEKASDLLVCVLNKEGTQIPGKLYHLSAGNKPILVILDGNKSDEMKEYLDQFNRFVTCSNTVESIYEAITRLMQSTEKWEPCEAFAPSKIAEQMLQAD